MTSNITCARVGVVRNRACMNDAQLIHAHDRYRELKVMISECDRRLERTNRILEFAARERRKFGENREQVIVPVDKAA